MTILPISPLLQSSQTHFFALPVGLVFCLALLTFSAVVNNIIIKVLCVLRNRKEEEQEERKKKKKKTLSRLETFSLNLALCVSFVHSFFLCARGFFVQSHSVLLAHFILHTMNKYSIFKSWIQHFTHCASVRACVCFSTHAQYTYYASISASVGQWFAGFKNNIPKLIKFNWIQQIINSKMGQNWFIE